MLRFAALSRWLARLGATAITGLFIAFLVGEGRPDVRELSDAELGGFAAVFLMVVGTLLGWRKDLLGAALLLGGFALFYSLERGSPPLPFWIYGVAGLLLLASGLIRLLARHLTRPRATSPSPAVSTPPPAPPTA